MSARFAVKLDANGQAGLLVQTPDGSAVVPVNADANGNIGTFAAPSPEQGWIPYGDFALSNSPVTVKAAPGAVIFFNVFNPNSSVAWLQIFDAAGAVTVGVTAPVLSFALPSGGLWESPWSPQSLVFEHGIIITATTTTTGGVAPASPVVLNGGYI